MNELQHGDRVRIDEYGGDDASSTDKLFNGATGTVDLEDNPGVHYIRVELDPPVTVYGWDVRTDVLCDPDELTVI